MRRLREQPQWNQTQLVGRLSLSLSYISQIENNQRPVTAGVLLKLAEVFGGDVAQFSEEHDRRQLGELVCALRDRTLRSDPLPADALVRFTEQASELVDAFLALYQRHGRLQEEHAQTVDRFYGDLGADAGNGRRREALVPLPHEEVRDHFNRRNNYLDALDRLGEALAAALDLVPGQRAAALRDGGFVDPATQALARQGFAHYFAGAVLLPYAEFLAAAQRCRYDIEWLQQRFHVGFETVCHRLSTLQRQGARGVPFYFVRLDQAGNVSKRQSATAFHFARHGGACPLWHVHEAFAQPERILTQVAEMSDGTRFFGIARTSSRGGGGFRSRRNLFVIGLGCELSHARELVYADGIDPERPRDVAPIGPGCHVCPRADCVQRAFPPAGKALVTDSDAGRIASSRSDGCARAMRLG